MSADCELQEKYAQLKAVIEQHKGVKGPLMPVMQKAQGIFGHLPLDVQKLIAEGLNVPLTDVYGVSTFYAQFSLEPKGKHTVGVCLGTACYVRGAQKVMDTVSQALKIEPGKTTPDGLFTLEATRCLGCCGLAPVMMIGDDVFGRLAGDAKEIGGILDKYRA